MTSSVPEPIASVLGRAELRYSQVWEDHRLLEEGLAVGADDDVLSIASAGDNALALLLQGPRSVTAIDLNPAQMALVELKVAAIRRLSHAEMVALLGVREGPDRLGLYERLRGELSAASRAFLDGFRGEIAAGIVRAGKLDRWIAGFHRDHLAARVAPGTIERFMDLDDPAEQARQFDGIFGAPWARAAYLAHFGRESHARRGRDAAQIRFVGEDFDVGEWGLRSFRRACTELPLRGNFYMGRFVGAPPEPLEAGPPYLRPASFERLRGLVDRLRLVTTGLDDHIAAAAPGAYSKANLSNLFEYFSEDETAATLGALAAKMRPGGRIAYWNLYVPRSSPASLRHRLRPLAELSESLWRRDRSWFYRAFHVEEIVAP